MLSRHLAEKVISYGINTGQTPGTIAELLNETGLITDDLLEPEEQIGEGGEIQIHSGISAYPIAGFIQDTHANRTYWPDEARGRALALLTAAHYVEGQHG